MTEVAQVPAATAGLTAPPVLDLGAIRLRAWRITDGQRLIEASNDPLVRRFIPHTPLPRTPEAVSGYLERIQALATSGDRIAWCVADATTDLALGNVALFDIEPPSDQGTAQVGYWAHPDARGRGILSSAVAGAARWSMRRVADGGLGIRRLYLLTAVSNVASQRLAERAGFVRVGTERESAPTADGGWEDNALYDRLRDDPTPPALIT
jgi:RimJ/RimL family protein N-acetyltransferase